MTLNRLDVPQLRKHFPALQTQCGERPAVFFDGPAGSQVPQAVADAVSDYLLHSNANHGGVFATSRQSDAMLAQAHHAAADFVGAADPGEVVFGANMTSLTFALSRALARTWRSGDEVVVTRLDHDANVTPWVLAARDAGAIVRHVAITGDCTLDMDDLRRQLSPRTRLVAVGCASNAVGTINPVGEIAQLAHAVGALVFLDAVHYAPHALPSIAAWNCDFLACSAYKFFGPHIGILWGRRSLLEALPAYKVRPAAESLPDRWMTGTQSHEAIAGTLAAIEYLQSLSQSPAPTPRREALARSYELIAAHERSLLTRLLDGLEILPSVKVWGITGRERLHERVPTISISHRRLKPREVALALAEQGIFVWHGNFYALPLTEALGVEPDGLVRIGLLHYNTPEEVDRLIGALRSLELG